MVEISVIIPNFNHAKFLTERIESVINQTFENFEVIILDDASTDTSLEIIESYRRHPKVASIVVNKSNSSSTFEQWCKGISMAKGTWIWIAESDDYADVSFLQEVFRNRISKDISLIFTLSNYINDCGDFIEYAEQISLENEMELFQGMDFINTYLHKWNYISNASAVIFRKEHFKKISNDYKNLKLTGDWLVWLELIKCYKLLVIKKKLNYFRVHGSTVRSKTNWSTFQFEHIYILNRIISYKNIDKEKVKSTLLLRYKSLSGSYKKIFNLRIMKKYGINIINLYLSFIITVFKASINQLGKLEQ